MNYMVFNTNSRTALIHSSQLAAANWQGVKWSIFVCHQMAQKLPDLQIRVSLLLASIGKCLKMGGKKWISLLTSSEHHPQALQIVDDYQPHLLTAPIAVHAHTVYMEFHFKVQTFMQCRCHTIQSFWWQFNPCSWWLFIYVLGQRRQTNKKRSGGTGQGN